MLLKKTSFIILSLFILTSCAILTKQTNSTFNKVEISTKEIEHSFYLIGDAGNAALDSSTIALTNLKKTLKNSSTQATVVFLGDNIYPKGLPDKESKSRELAKHRLQIQINSVENFKGKTIFIPGNHDWYSQGVKGLKRQQDYVEKHLGKNSFLPKDGCPIKTIDITDNIVMIVVDSQWYVTNWDKHPTINDECELKTRHLFLEEFRGEIKKARGKTTLVAIHHPMFTNGIHGGQNSFKDHLKPIPVLGTIKNILRTTTGVVNADLSNKFYNELKMNLVAASKQNDKVIFLSGHEHNLQYLVESKIPQIISGSGSKITGTRNIRGGQFSYAANGFAVLDIYKDGSSSVKFITSKENNIEFQAQIFKPDVVINDTQYPILKQDSLKKSILTKEETSKSKTYEFLFGERFREDYSTSVSAKVVYLDTLLGGLSPMRKGGGTQSKTLHLKASDGKRYVMRAMKKQASQFIQAAIFQDQYVQDLFKDTYSENLVLDIFTGSYPYSTFVIGTLSDAISLSHLNPKLYYIPKQKALGGYNEDFGDELYMFEEHASDGHTELASGNFTGEIVSTMDMMAEISSDESKEIDQAEYIKARLFDMLIGDFDRHQDQWRWLEYKEDNKTIYRPLPRDRDQPFSKMSDGIIAGTAVTLIPNARSFRKYDSDLEDVKGFTRNSYPLDMALITNSNKSVWDKQVAFIQTQITDKVIDDAFNNVPNEANRTTISEIKDLLKSRRANLQKISDRYFKMISKYVVIKATNKDDYIKIESNTKGEVTVRLLRKKDDTVKDEFHNRTYDPKYTKEIWIYGLDDDDTFEVKGKSTKIKIRLIGGQNNDNYIVENGKNVVIYDYKSKKNDISEAKKAKIKLQDKYNINVYDYKKLRNNVNQLIPYLGSNPDDGFKIGATNTYTVYGFERNPFTSQHNIKAAYYFATNGYELNYKGEFANIFTNTNLIIESKFNSPNFSLNFFGYGNQTPYDDDLDLDHNRVKVREFSIAPSLMWKSYGGSEVSVGVNYESIEVDHTENRFVENNIQLPNYIFDENQFAGINAKFHFENYDSKAYPTMGMDTSIEFGYKTNLDNTIRNFAYLIPEIGFTHKLNSSGSLVLGTKLKSHIIFNDNFEFYQAASIGGADGLRGYRNQRFTGKQSFYQNTDIRYSFKSMKTGFMPIRLGVYGGFDYGRVWIDQEDSDKWNNSYGIGVFMNVVELVSANLEAFNSDDGVRVAFSLGFGF